MAEGRPSAPPPHQHQQHMQFLNVMQGTKLITSTQQVPDGDSMLV